MPGRFELKPLLEKDLARAGQSSHPGSVAACTPPRCDCRCPGHHCTGFLLPSADDAPGDAGQPYRTARLPVAVTAAARRAAFACPTGDAV